MADGQPIRIKTPLAASDLVIRTLRSRDEIARPFRIDLELLSPHEDLAFDDVLGLDATVTLALPEGGERHFHGLISEFAQVGRRGDMAAYTMQMRPWLWFLTRTADCRIFQEMTVPDILKQLFREFGLAEFRDALSGTYRTWEYLVQYRETDFNFISRLMEQEGIYYYVEHEDGKHTLVLADAYGAHSPIADYEEIPYFPPTDNANREEHISDWSRRRTVSSGAYALRAYDFRKPRANLESTHAIVQGHAQADYELYDYPGEYYEKTEGDEYVRARMEEAQSGFERTRAETDARGLFAGGLFSLKEYPRKDQNKEYLVVAADCVAELGDYETSGGEFDFQCSFEALDSQIPFRAVRITPKPVVKGPQTAIVTGPSGEEIWTDEYGRVKVQFHWDRYGKNDENSSCWVRVAQVWAGTNWGAMYIPRIGQEVIVDFVEGDPDRPIITGRVYNNDNMPPYDLPAEKTKSTLKSRSSKSGTPDNFNEIRFEDKKGSEELYFHAEKDQTVTVENDKNESVGHDNTENVGNDETIEVGNNRSKTVGVDQSESIGNNKTIEVGTDHTEQIGSNKKMTVGANHDETIGANETKKTGADKTVTVGSNHTETVGANQSINIGSNQTENVASNVAQTVGGAKAETIAQAKALSVGGGYQVTVGGAKNQTVGGNKSEQVGGDSSSQVAKKYSLNAGDDIVINGGKKGAIALEDELSISVGKATIVLKKNGDISINGKKISVKGSGDIVLKGSKVGLN